TRPRGSLEPAKEHPITHFLDLEALAVRDLVHLNKGEILVLGGPVGKASGPFGLFRLATEQKPLPLRTTHNRPIDPANEKPEGISLLKRDGRDGIIVLYDSPDPCKRIDGSTYSADSFPF